MILNNFWKFYSYTSSLTTASGQGYELISCGQVDLNGNEFSSQQLPTPGSSKYLSSMFRPFMPSVLILKFGTGTTEPTPLDYCMENDITSNFIGVTTNNSVIYADNRMSILMTFSGTNNTSTAYTVSEIGIVLAASDSNYNEHHMLIARQLLSDPKTANPNEVFDIEVRFDFQ